MPDDGYYVLVRITAGGSRPWPVEEGVKKALEAYDDTIKCQAINVSNAIQVEQKVRLNPVFADHLLEEDQ